MSYSRKLVSIMFTDIVGYTKLMQESESAAVEIRTRHRGVIEQLHQKYQGKLIQYYGDGSLSIFDSAIESVKCAVDIQIELSKEPFIPLRIGLHLGDVLITESDIIGNSVNITSRIESMAQPGTVLISNQIREQISNHNIALDFLGTFHFKNDDKKRDIYAVVEKGLLLPDKNKITGKLENETIGPTTDLPSVSENADEDFGEEVRKIILQHLDDPDFSVPVLCKKIGCSRPQLYRKLQALYSLSPSDYIREVRLQEAAKLLDQKTGNVSEIAYKTGFNNLSYFSKVFQERFGQQPSAYGKDTSNRFTLKSTLDTFIGRKEEIEAIANLLERNRLLTLTGTGGTGKTRLSMKVLERVNSRYPGGFFVIQLAPVSEVSGVIPKIAQILKIKQNASKETRVSIIESIRDQKVLILLDNFEHVLDAATEIHELLLECPQLTIMVTSRIALSIAGEREFPVRQLGTPDTNREYTLEELTKIPAVGLLIDRAQSVKPNFSLTEENKEAVISICQRLDGLPLALELAAARIKIFSPQALCKRISSSLDILSSSAPSHPDRHKTLRTAIDWSYNLLQPEEQTLFRRLSVFAGGCTLESAEDVCFEGYRDNLAFLDHMSSLVDKSLIYQVDQEDGEPRFFMLETLRAFGLEKLEASQEKEAVMSRYIAYFLHLLEDKPVELTKGNVKEALDEVELELDNIRSLLAYADRTGRIDIGLKIGSYIWRYWVIRSMMREGTQWLDRILNHAPENLVSKERCVAMNAYGIMMSLTQNWRDAIEALEGSYKISHEQGYDHLAGEALNHLGWAYLLVPIIDMVIDRNTKALEINRSCGNKRGIAVSLNNLAWFGFWTADYTQAMRDFEESKQLRLEIGDIRGYAYALTNEAMCKIHFGRFDGVLSQISEALDILIDLSDDQLIAWATTMQGVYYYFNGKIDEALNYLAEARKIWSRIGTPVGYFWTDVISSEIRLDQNDLEGVQELLDGVISRTESYAGMQSPSVYLAYAKFLYVSGNLDEALKTCLKNIEFIYQRKLLIYFPQALELMSLLLLEKNLYQFASTIFANARAYRTKLDMPLPKVYKPMITKIENKFERVQDELVESQHSLEGESEIHDLIIELKSLIFDDTQ